MMVLACLKAASKSSSWPGLTGSSACSRVTFQWSQPASQVQRSGSGPARGPNTHLTKGSACGTVSRVSVMRCRVNDGRKLTSFRRASVFRRRRHVERRCVHSPGAFAGGVGRCCRCSCTSRPGLAARPGLYSKVLDERRGSRVRPSPPISNNLHIQRDALTCRGVESDGVEGDHGLTDFNRERLARGRRTDGLGLANLAPSGLRGRGVRASRTAPRATAPASVRIAIVYPRVSPVVRPTMRSSHRPTRSARLGARW